MSQASKAKAAKKRAHQQRLKEQEQAALEKKAKELKTRVAGFGIKSSSSSNSLKKAREIYLSAKMPQYVKQREVNHVGSVAERFEFAGSKVKPIVQGELTPELQQREQQAQDRLREIKKRVDIGYNKGGLMLLSEGEVEAMKRGELRRRS